MFIKSVFIIGGAEIIGIMILFLLLIGKTNSPVDAQEVASSPVQEMSVESKRIDDRALILHDYLVLHHSPVQNYAQDFIDAADAYHIDWKWIPAIAGTESTFCAQVPGGTIGTTSSHNCWGWGVYGTQAIYFKSWREGMFTVAKGLKERYFNRGLTNPYTINTVYASSPFWGAHTSYFLNDIEQFAQNYEAKNSNSISAVLSTTQLDSTLNQNIPQSLPQLVFN